MQIEDLLNNPRILKTVFLIFKRSILFYENSDFNNRYKNEIDDNDEKCGVDQAIHFPKNSILRAMVFIETTRQRWGNDFLALYFANYRLVVYS